MIFVNISFCLAVAKVKCLEDEAGRKGRQQGCDTRLGNRSNGESLF